MCALGENICYNKDLPLIVCRLIICKTVSLTMEVLIMDIIKVFGTNVKKLRLERNLSQEKFAELCGLHRTYISDIECFTRNVSLETVQKIADTLGIDSYKLLMGV